MKAEKPMKKQDINSLYDNAVKLEARARQMRQDAHEAACKNAIEHVAIAERELSRADNITIAVGQRSEAVDATAALFRIRKRLEAILHIEGDYVPTEEDE